MTKGKKLFSTSDLFLIEKPTWNGNWENVDYDTRLKFILESVKIFYDNLQNNGEEVGYYPVKIGCKLSHDERLIYVRHMGAPETPPLKFDLFFKQQYELKMKFSTRKISNVDIEDLFSKLSKAEKFDCYKKHIEAVEYFIELEKNWKIKQKDKLAIYLHEVYCKKQIYGLNTRIPKVKKIELKEIDCEVTSVKMKTLTSVFKFPPMTVYKLFRKIKGDKCSKNKMHHFLKIVLLDILNDIKKSLAQEILEYVGKLDISDQKLFIGLNRKSYLIEFCGKDIFEKMYPVENFPAFYNSLNKSLKIESDDEYFSNCRNNSVDSLNEREIINNVETNVNDNFNMPEDFDPYVAVRNSIRTLFENL